MVFFNETLASLAAMPTHAIWGVWLYVVWAIAEGAIHYAGVFQPEQPDRRGAGLTWLLVAFKACVAYGFVDAALLQRTTLPAWAEPLTHAGAVLVAVAIAVRVAARLTIGQNFSGYVQTYDRHRLVTRGVYSLVRHPAYTAYLGFLVGFPLCFGSWGALLVGLAIGTPALWRRIRVEEACLAEWFGDDYQAYRRRTKRLVPFVW